MSARAMTDTKTKVTEEKRQEQFALVDQARRAVETAGICDFPGLWRTTIPCDPVSLECLAGLFDVLALDGGDPGMVVLAPLPDGTIQLMTTAQVAKLRGAVRMFRQAVYMAAGEAARSVESGETFSDIDAVMRAPAWSRLKGPSSQVYSAAYWKR